MHVLLSAVVIDAAWLAAQSQIPAWRTMTTRLADVTDSAGRNHGRRRLRRPAAAAHDVHDRSRQATVVEDAKTFQSFSAGRRLRSWLRFAHTGEIYGSAGQTIAGLVSAGGAVLVYTGIALALQPFCRLDWPPASRSYRLPARAAKSRDSEAA